MVSWMKKRRSDIAKLVSHARNVWRQSENYQAVKKSCKVPGRSGWFKCALVGEIVEVIKIDHIKAIGRQPDTMEEFGQWLPKLFCHRTNLQGLCSSCHKIKTSEDRRRMQ